MIEFLFSAGSGLFSGIRTLITSVTYINASDERREKRNTHKRENKAEYFSRVNVDESVKTKYIPGIQEYRNNSNTTYGAAFSPHAIHGALPSKHVKTKRKKGNSKFAHDSIHNRATNKFHSTEFFRLPFSGHKIENLNDTAIEKIEDDIVNDLVRAPNIANKNNEITIVSSEIGCGKSTLLTNIMYRINSLELNRIAQRPKGTVPLEVALISFDKMFVDLKKDDISSRETIKNYAKNTIYPYVLSKIITQTNLEGESLEQVFNSLNAETFILIFDDMDEVYKVFCKALLIEQDEFDPKQGVEQFFPFIFELIESFSSGVFSQLSIRCVFGMRLDTLSMVERYVGPSTGESTIIKNLRAKFTLDDISGEQIKEVIRKRIKLGCELETDADKVKCYECRSDSLKNLRADFDVISKVSVQGLRHTLHLIQQLEWCFWKQDTFDRFFHKTGNLLKLFLCDGHSHFSQINAGVTNIFLVNNAYRIENNPVLIDGRQAFSKEYLINHKQTYFLKFLLLDFIQITGSTDKTEILNLFAGCDKYEKQLVELVLFSLCEVRHGRLVKPEIHFDEDAVIRSSGLTSTPRGKHFISTSLFWNFHYLSLVVEDHWLQLPNFLVTKFSNPIGLDYLSSTDEKEYQSGHIQFLKEKAYTVSAFLNLLEIAFKYENKSKRALFMALKTKGCNFPNFKKIKIKCRVQLKEALKDANNTDVKSILKIYDSNCAIFEKSKLKLRLRKTFNNCY